MAALVIKFRSSARAVNALNHHLSSPSTGHFLMYGFGVLCLLGLEYSGTNLQQEGNRKCNQEMY